MKHLLLLFIVLSFLSSALATAPADLGQGLAYLRVHSLAADYQSIDAAVRDSRALVLDLRYIDAPPGSLKTLQDSLARRPAAATLFVLLSPATPDGLAATLPANAFTLGIPQLNPAPKITVQQTPAADRQAYDALETGTPLSALITGKIEKERYDESSLVQDFRNGNSNPAPPPLPNPTTGNAAAPPGKVPPPTDRVLQRALHLHRALLALRPR